MKSMSLKTLLQKPTLLLLLGLSLFSLNALAMSLQEAKSQGYLGEQLNGYLGLVQNNSDAKAVMDEVNNKRRAPN